MADSRAHTSVISAYANARDAVAAKSRFDMMVSNKFKPSVITFGALLKAYVNAKDAAGCKDVLRMMTTDFKVDPNQAMLRMYSKLVGKDVAKTDFAEFTPKVAES